jgi:two-component system, OmpR family, phosphate regulon sensor histidine kinase PhoR
VLSSLPSVPSTDGRGELRRRFVEAARRAQIVTLVHRARTEAELGDLVTAELCEAFEAEIAFVLAPGDDRRAGVVGAYGLRPDEAERLPAQGVLDRSIEVPQHFAGPNLLTVGARALVLAPFQATTARGVVGVARLHDERFGEAEAALLEAVAENIAHALERLRLGEERDRLYRQAREQAQAARVIGSIADGVVLVDDAGVVQLWNPAAEAITGLQRDAVVGRPLHEGIPAWSAVADSLRAVREPASSSARATTVPIDLRGRELWLSIRAVGFAEGTVYAFHDLTEERRLEQLKADFIATVSHELRTPLAAVHGAAKTLLRDDVDLGDDVSRQLLALVSEQSDRLARMVEDILLASTLESPELELATERVDVSELAADAIAAARMHAGEQVTLELAAAPSLPQVAADRDKLRQVLVNLVGNAVKYSPAGGRIDVEVRAEDGHVAVLVRDEGLGIAPSEQNLIFEKFYRADANMTRGVSGSGLGLYISRELVHRMGGTISVESEPGEGSTFVVTLPAAVGPGAIASIVNPGGEPGGRLIVSVWRPGRRSLRSNGFRWSLAITVCGRPPSMLTLTVVQHEVAESQAT